MIKAAIIYKGHNKLRREKECECQGECEQPFELDKKYVLTNSFSWVAAVPRGMMI